MSPPFPGLSVSPHTLGISVSLPSLSTAVFPHSPGTSSVLAHAQAGVPVVPATVTLESAMPSEPPVTPIPTPVPGRCWGLGDALGGPGRGRTPPTSGSLPPRPHPSAAPLLYSRLCRIADPPRTQAVPQPPPHGQRARSTPHPTAAPLSPRSAPHSRGRVSLLLWSPQSREGCGVAGGGMGTLRLRERR